EVPSELPKVSLVNASLKKLKFHLTQFDSVVKKRTTPNDLEQAQIQDKVFVITSLKNDLRKLKGKEIVENVVHTPSATTIAPVDLAKANQPLDSGVRLVPCKYATWNSGVSACICSQEAGPKALIPYCAKNLLSNPMNNVRKLGVKYSTSNCGSKPPSNKKNDRTSQTPSRNKKNKVEAQPRKVNKVNRVVKPVCDVDVKHSLSKVNSEILCATCNKSMFDGVHDKCLLNLVVQIVLWYRDSECSKHLTGNRSQLMNFVSKFLGTVRFGNGQIARIMGYGDYQLGNLAKDGLARGIPRHNFHKDHLCSACALGKSKKSSHQLKAEDTNQKKLYLFHMDLCGPMRMASINGKRYILVIVDDYSRFTWVRFLKTKDEAPVAIIKCIKNIQVRLNAIVWNVRTDNGTEFVNQTLREWRNRTLVEAARTMLIFSKAPLFLWAEAISTACYTQNHSLICHRYNKTPYELMQDKKLDLSFFQVFGSLCYPTNDHEDLGKFDAKADIGVFVGYAPAKKAFRIYNRRTGIITDTIHVTFDELIAMASE
ncbi:retrovirus-related pol polyprotein from transposon TNT 1-94, partial [Tanacetum coccineum]